MAAQPFDPTALANALKNLGAASNITEKLKSDWADISKNLSEQEKNQRRLNVLTNLQSDIASIISEQKKASIVYDEASFNLEKRKLELQQEIYQAQMKRIDEEISAGILTRDQLQAAESFKNNLLMQKIALDGNLKVYEKQKDEGKKIEDQFKLVNDQLIQERKNISDVNIDLVATSKISKLIGDIMSELKIPASFSSLLKQTYERFKEIDKTATEVRQTFALFRQDAEYIEKNIKNISTDLAKFGVAAKDVASTSKSIGSAFSSIDIANTSLVSDITLLSKQMGITSDRSVGFLKTIGGIKGQSAVANKNMLGLAGASAKAYGVGLDDVMADVANASEEARMYAGKNADEMVRAAAQARQMGTTLDSMSRAAKGLLDFESSIQAELKASALIGKNINFNEARRLAFQGKVVEANKLILDQAKKIKFNQLNPIAQEAFAKAAGKTVKELQDMLEAETRIKDALNSQDPVVRKIAQERLKEQNLLKTNSKLAQQKFEQDLKTKANQERLAIVQNKINDALQKLMLPVLEFISKTMDGIVYIFEKFNPEELIGPLIRIKLMFTSVGTALRESLLFPLRVASGYLSKLGEVGWIKNLLLPITMLIEKTKLFIGNFQYVRSLGTNFAQSFLSAGNAVGGIFSKIGKLLAGIAVPIDFVISKFNIFKTFVSSIFNALKTLVSSIFSPITNAIKPIIGAFKSVGEGSKFLKPLLGFLKIGKLGLTAVPILGEIIMAIEFIYNAWKRISVIFNDPNLNIGQKIFASVVGLYGALYDTLIQPFIDIGEWIIKAVWGEDILKGIKAVVNDIYTILKSPFEKAYNWIMDLLGGKSPSKIGLAIVDGIESVVDMLFDVITYPFKKAAQIIPEIINILKTTFVYAFKSAMDAMFDVITYPFKKAAQIIPEIINILKTTFVDAFKSVVDIIFDLITYPFKKGFELIKSAVSEVGAFLKDTFSGAFTFIIGALEKVWEKMKGIGSFISDTIGKTFSFVGRIVGTSEETPSKTATESKTSVKTDDLLINTIVNSNRVLAEKLDKLTSMMASGQIAVYIDGQRANQLLATSNSKFGSFGQATTN
jgi:hypothetical protein